MKNATTEHFLSVHLSLSFHVFVSAKQQRQQIEGRDSVERQHDANEHERLVVEEALRRRTAAQQAFDFCFQLSVGARALRSFFSVDVLRLNCRHATLQRQRRRRIADGRRRERRHRRHGGLTKRRRRGRHWRRRRRKRQRRGDRRRRRRKRRRGRHQRRHVARRHVARALDVGRADNAAALLLALKPTTKTTKTKTIKKKKEKRERKKRTTLLTTYALALDRRRRQ